MLLQLGRDREALSNMQSFLPDPRQDQHSAWQICCGLCLREHNKIREWGQGKTSTGRESTAQRQGCTGCTSLKGITLHKPVVLLRCGLGRAASMLLFDTGDGASYMQGPGY